LIGLVKQFCFLLLIGLIGLVKQFSAVDRFSKAVLSMNNSIFPSVVNGKGKRNGECTFPGLHASFHINGALYSICFSNHAIVDNLILTCIMDNKYL
jgi:hypothetical protein